MLTIESAANRISSFWPEWIIEEEIGEGAHGTVFRAVSISANEAPCAIKIIQVPQNHAEVVSFMSEGNNELTTKAYFWDLVNNYIDEIRIMEKLQNVENVVRILDYKVVSREDEIGWDIYIRMELLTPFLSYSSSHDMTQEDIIDIGMQICYALKACSEFQIIHRDIKPENIFISEDGIYKLGDFGIAKRLERKTATLSQKGTYNYMAPEVYKGNPYTENVDVYSLGLVLYRELNNKRNPFLPPTKQLITYKERMDAFEKRMAGEPLPPPVNAGPALSALILRACEYDPAKRYPSAAEMLAALTKAKAAISKGPRAEESFSRRVIQKRPHRRFLLYVFPFAMLIAIAGIGAYLSPRSNDTAPSSSIRLSEDVSPVIPDDHEMIWSDPALEEAMKEVTGKDNIYLHDLWNLTDLNLKGKGISDISSLSELTNLTSLILSDNQISDISPLEVLVNLNYLDLSGNKIDDITALHKLTKLNNLYLDHNGVSDLTPIAALTRVTDLNISYNPLSSLDAVSAFEGLTTLTASDVASRQKLDFTPLKSLKHVSVLNLSDNGLTDISWMSTMIEMKDLCLSNNAIAEISALSQMPALTAFYAGDNRISDITPLAQASRLAYIDLQHNPLQDISVLSELPALIWLDLEECGLHDILALKNNTDLISLDVSGNYLTDIDVLSNFSRMAWLDISSNSISGSLDILLGMHDLYYLDISNNLITDIHALKGKEELRYLFLSSNPINDYSAIDEINIEELRK